MYKYDLESSKHGLYRPNAEKWGTAIIKKCWKFALELWDLQNRSEHGENGSDLNIQREKAIEESFGSRGKLDR
jgi:hypothetical protein